LLTPKCPKRRWRPSLNDTVWRQPRYFSLFGWVGSLPLGICICYSFQRGLTVRGCSGIFVFPEYCCSTSCWKINDAIHWRLPRLVAVDDGLKWRSVNWLNMPAGRTSTPLLAYLRGKYCAATVPTAGRITKPTTVVAVLGLHCWLLKLKNYVYYHIRNCLLSLF
jgi:hypothetical protein